MAPLSYSTEQAFIQLWKWLTNNGTTEPGSTAPTVDPSDATPASASTFTNPIDVATDTTPPTVLAANTDRISATVENTGAVAVRVADPGVTPSATRGHLLDPGESYTWTGSLVKKCATGAIKAYSATAGTVSVSEES